MTVEVGKPGQSGRWLKEAWNTVSEDSGREVERGYAADSFRPEPEL